MKNIDLVVSFIILKSYKHSLSKSKLIPVYSDKLNPVLNVHRASVETRVIMNKDDSKLGSLLEPKNSPIQSGQNHESIYIL